MTDKYCPRSKIKKLEVEMFPEESDKIEKYVGGLPDMIHESVMASRLKTMQDAIEMAIELMGKKSALLLNVKLRIRGNLKTTTKLNNNLPRDKMWLKFTPLGLVKGRRIDRRSDCPELKNQSYGKLLPSGIPAGTIPKNLLDRVSQLH
ncbi:hypothetical protein Tco_0980101 [Tanacetum coccineum]